ncbi:MAG: acetyl-CoA carboxylase biotin carboxylase subunit, partial [Candidatus Omnitrophica bacterium]|nr:acetyl-CoA carboxylase biotin carboxylase subunit [Candidatus Omnitrophota bacterium]
EVITGIDLVKEQIRIAAGEKLGYSQDDIKFRGHAIECRINAEDPDNKFMPSPGRIDSYHVPGGRGVRVDSHVYSGYTIPPHYDSMIGKIIAHGRNRKEAIYIMERALDEFIIEPIKTTLPFHKRVMADDAFIRGDIDTGYAENLYVEQEA